MKDLLRRNLIARMTSLSLLTLVILYLHTVYAHGSKPYPHVNSPAAEQCTYNQLSLQHEDEDAAMGGLRDMKFIFTNTSSSPCTLNGYPRFELLNKSGEPAAHAVNGLTRMGDDLKQKPQLVTIESGKTAIFWIDYLARGAGSTKRPCPTYSKFRVTAPGIARAFMQKSDSPVEVCSGLEVSPVMAPSDQQ